MYAGRYYVCKRNSDVGTILVATLKPLQDAVNCIQLRCLTYSEISVHLCFICMYTMEWYSLLYDLANGIRFIYCPTKSVRNKIKAFIWINSKSGHITTLRMKWNIELFVADRKYICEVKVLLLSTIFITFFPPSDYMVVLFISLIRKFSPKISHLNCLWAKRMWKMFFWFSFRFRCDSWPCTENIPFYFARVLL